MLLIFPPAAKACEPPAGIAKLAGALKAHHIPCTLLDANLEGMLSLLGRAQTASDTWTRRAAKNITTNLAAFKNPLTYQSPARYSRAVRDVNRLLEVSAKPYHAVLGLADYHHEVLSPVRSADLLAAAEHPEQNLFYGYFNRRLPEIIENHFSPQRRGERGDEGESKNASPLVGFSLNYLSQALCTFAMIGYLRKEFPGLKIVLGGGLVSSWVKRPGWADPFGGLVDHIIAGPGESALLELLGVRNDQQTRAVPDYGALPTHAYLSPGFILPYSASSGCYWNRCSFCPETAEGNPYVPVPALQALSDLESLTVQTRPALIHLLDNAVSPALMRAFVEKPSSVPWYGFARVSRELADLEFCMALKRSGCAMLKLGLESGDQAVLDKLRKGIDLAMASRVLLNLQKAGIAAYVYLLFGTPAETAVEARKTLAFVAQHAKAITFLNLAIFNMPLCGEQAGAYGTEHFYEGDLSLYTGFRHPAGWDRKLVRQFLESEFKRHSAVAEILKHDPPFFTSNHAPFFTFQ